MRTPALCFCLMSSYMQGQGWGWMLSRLAAATLCKVSQCTWQPWHREIACTAISHIKCRAQVQPKKGLNTRKAHVWWNGSTSGPTPHGKSCVGPVIAHISPNSSCAHHFSITHGSAVARQSGDFQVRLACFERLLLFSDHVTSAASLTTFCVHLVFGSLRR